MANLSHRSAVSLEIGNHICKSTEDAHFCFLSEGRAMVLRPENRFNERIEVFSTHFLDQMPLNTNGKVDRRKIDSPLEINPTCMNHGKMNLCDSPRTGSGRINSEPVGRRTQ